MTIGMANRDMDWLARWSPETSGRHPVLRGQDDAPPATSGKGGVAAEGGESATQHTSLEEFASPTLSSDA